MFNCLQERCQSAATPDIMHALAQTESKRCISFMIRISLEMRVSFAGCAIFQLFPVVPSQDSLVWYRLDNVDGWGTPMNCQSHTVGDAVSFDFHTK